MKDKEDDWDEYLAGAVFALNNIKSTTTGYSPFFMMHGRHPRLPLQAEMHGQDLDLEWLAKTLNTSEEVEVCVENLNKLKKNIYKQASENIERTQERQGNFYNKKRMRQCLLKDGDLVLRRNMLQKTKKGHKMEDKWLGPYTIANLDVTKGLCNLKSQKGQILKNKVNIKQLKQYIPSTNSTNPQPVSAHLLDAHKHDTLSLVPPTSKPTDPHNSFAQSGTCTVVPPTSKPTDPPSPFTLSSSSGVVPSSNHDKVKLFNSTIIHLRKQTLLELLQRVMGELEGVVNGTCTSWKYELVTTGRCKQYPSLKKFDLKFNTHLGGFTEKQIELVTKAIEKEFPQEKNQPDILLGALLPEALQRVAREALGLTMSEAEEYFREALKEDGNNYYQRVIAKVKGKVTKKKRPKRKKKK